MKSALFFLLTCALTLGACSDRDPVSANQPTEAAAKRRISSITRTSFPVAGLAESRVHPLGVVEVSAGEPVQIRSLLAHTVVPSVATWLRYSTELAIQDFGSIHGHEVELGDPIDAMCSPEGGRAGAEQVIADPQVLGIIGTLCSGSAVETSPLLSAAGLVMVSPTNTSPTLTSDLAGNASPDYHPGYFRTAGNDLYQGQAVADFAYHELELRRMVSIDDGDPFTMGLTIAFGNAFRALGGEIAVTARIEKGDTDMTEVLAEFAAAEPDGIFFPLFESAGSPFAEQVREFKALENATLITAETLLLSEFLGTPQSEGLYIAGPEAAYGSNVNMATGKNGDAILATLESTYGESPTSPYWAHAYDATTLLLSAINSVAVERGGKLYIDRAALREEIGATAGFQGIIGELSCDDFGDCGTGRVNIYHHTDSGVTDPAQLPVVYQFSPGGGDEPLGFEAGPLGSVEVGAGEAVQIRSLLSITGAASLGGALRNGVELAARDFGDVHGRAVELGESMDSMCSPDGGRAGAEQISADPQVLGVIGTSCSAAAVAASPVISEAGLVMISPSNTSPLLTSDLAGNANPNYHPGYFRTSNNDLYQANAVADFAYSELGLRRMVAVDDGDPYTTALVSAFGNAFGALGGEVAAIARIDKGDTDMTEVLAEFAAAEPDGIFFPLFEAEGTPFAEQALAFDGLENATLITGAALLVSEFLGTPQSEGMYFAGPESDHGANVNAGTGKNADEVLAAYEATYGGSPTSPYWAHAYDATTVLLSAIKSVAVEEGGKLHIDRAALREEIGATASFQGIIGELSCDDFGDCGTGRINIYHHTDTGITDTAQLPVVYQFAP